MHGVVCVLVDGALVQRWFADSWDIQVWVSVITNALALFITYCCFTAKVLLPQLEVSSVTVLHQILHFFSVLEGKQELQTVLIMPQTVNIAVTLE